MLTERGASNQVDGHLSSWLELANFVRVRDRRDPAACGCRFPSPSTDAIYSTKRRIRTEHSPDTLHVILPYKTKDTDETSPQHASCLTLNSPISCGARHGSRNGRVSEVPDVYEICPLKPRREASVNSIGSASLSQHPSTAR